MQAIKRLGLLAAARIVDREYGSAASITNRSAQRFSLSSHYATNSTTPPASLIFLSASRLKNLARTTMGISGIRPLPKTFE